MTLSNVHVVLERPRSAANVGAVARAVKNFGLGRLVVVGTLAYRGAEAAKLAPGAEDVLEAARYATDLADALTGAVDAIATTSRAGPGVLDPREAARRLVARAADGPVALVLGTEKTGLDNATLARFDAVATIPTAPGKRSLNLAQAAVVFAYELWRAGGEEQQPAPAPRPRAPRELIERLRAKAKEELLGAGYLNPRQPDAILDELVRTLLRAEPTAREVELVLGALEALRRKAT